MNDVRRAGGDVGATRSQGMRTGVSQGSTPHNLCPETTLDKEGEPREAQAEREALNGFKGAPTLELMEGGNGYLRA